MKKFLLSIGTVAAVATSIIAVVSCGSTQKVAEHNSEENGIGICGETQ